MTNILIITVFIYFINISSIKAYENWHKSSNNQLLFSKVCQSGIREDNTNYIYCARKSLTQVPKFSRNNVIYDELVLADNRITELRADSFSRIKVKKVFLNGNPIRSIDQMTFRKLENHLEELWIDGDAAISSKNLLAQPLFTANGGLPKAIVEYLRNLNSLHIRSFMVKVLKNGIMSKLNRIEILSLKFCSIERIEPFAFEGLDRSLKELYLDGNLMEEIPSKALLSIKFKQLKILSLAQNRIKVINHDSFSSNLMTKRNLNTLIKLDLSYNGLKEINPAAFLNLNNSLKTLKLQNNEINSFNLRFLSYLSSLVELNLAFNVITGLPENTFIQLNKLEVLELQGNSIKFTESSRNILNGLMSLRRLNLARNNFEHLPNKMFVPVNNLKSLYLDKNPIINLNRQSFDGIYQTLKNISLQNVELKSSDLEALRNFNGLERVKLGLNKIDELDWNIFDRSHATISTLELRKNQIENMYHSECKRMKSEWDCEKKMDKLVELDLSNNKLCSFDGKMLKKMPHLKSLSLSHNPLYCDCGLLPLYRWTQTNFDSNMISYIQWQCEVPKENDGRAEYRKFTSVAVNEFKCFNGSNRCKKTTSDSGVILLSSTTKQSYKNSLTDSLVAEKIETKISEVKLDVKLNSILMKWSIDSDLSEENSLSNKKDISGFKITFNQLNSTLKSFLVDAEQRSFKLQNLDYNTKYSVCISVVQYQGYNKYCKDIKTSENKISQSPTRSEKLSTLSTTTTDLKVNEPELIPSLMIAVLIVIVVLIIGLIIFIYVLMKKRHSKEKQRTKSLMMNNSSNPTMSSRRLFDYQGPRTTTLEPSKKIIELHKGGCGNIHQIASNSSSPQSTSTISNPNFCSCLQINQNNGLINTIGKQFTIGDTSTVSSTISTDNNLNCNNHMKILNTKNLKINPNYNVKLPLQDMEYCGNNNEHYNREILKSVPEQFPHPSDLISSSPTSFQHFTLMNNQNLQYIPIDINNQKISNTSNSNTTSQYDKLSKINKLILSNNNGEHVYCEIPSNVGTNNRGTMRNFNFNNNQNPNLCHYNNKLNTLHHNLVNESLIMATPNNQNFNYFDNLQSKANTANNFLSSN